VELPTNVTGTNLYARLAADKDLLSALTSMRKVVEALAGTTNSTVPSYTDHTIKHMDALWAVSDQILTGSEVERMTPAEAFLLSAGFYLHDVGMAYAVTKDGLQRIQTSAPYRAYVSGQPEPRREDTSVIASAVAIAVRQLHANAANELATNDAYPVDSGSPTYSVLSGGNRAATRTPFDGRCPFACPVPEGLL
jgi:hypothetical protein